MSRPSISGFESDLRVSAIPVIILLAVLGGVTCWLASMATIAGKPLAVGGLLLALSLIAWLFEGPHPQIGRWLIVVGLIFVVQLLNSWLGMVGSLYLLILPVMIAAVLISLPAAAATAIAVTTSCPSHCLSLVRTAGHLKR